jgi:ATP-dependent exoDNAse (exonuclease V) beta subunit
LLRVVSRTVLIKGLEYDHVIIPNLERISDHCNLYVALTRARKSVTVIGRKSTITLSETTLSPRVSARDDHLRAGARYLAN